VNGEQAFGDLEGAAVDADILTEQDGFRPFAEDFPVGEGEGLGEGDGSQGRGPGSREF